MTVSTVDVSDYLETLHHEVTLFMDLNNSRYVVETEIYSFCQMFAALLWTSDKYRILYFWYESVVKESERWTVFLRV